MKKKLKGTLEEKEERMKEGRKEGLKMVQECELKRNNEDVMKLGRKEGMREGKERMNK